jgi:3-hydroxyisobutyrate dehydrogenase-like beta-hydroxyacid dehydrogenase
MKVAFVGLGNMGAPMAANLLRAGHDLVVYNRTPDRARALAAQGARVARSPREAAAGAEVLVTMLADDAAVEAVMLGAEGALEGLARGAIHDSMSTISPDLSRRLRAEHEARGQRYIAAPVFGRPEAAQAAKLWIVAAGPADAIERCRPLFDALGQGVDVAGDDPPIANVVKIGGNFVLAAAIEAMGEAFALVRKYGLDPARFIEIVNGRLLRSPVYENYSKIIVAERWEPPGFKLRHGLKDIRLALGASDEVEAPLPLASLMRDHYLSAVAWGWADTDWAALAKVSTVAAGLEGS